MLQQIFGVEIEHVIPLSFESGIEEQLALASLSKHKQTTAVFMQLLESAWLIMKPSLDMAITVLCITLR